ncbi:SpvB/TcaC N-terminal domain-containing protein [Pseudomonas sp. MG-9]|uniref:SpvB/TcaC N-terminal domain-containing protein n=1 Tax=Pseudomonas sp. MG-9 TaxID=2839032 RepID=UPI002078DC4A|nr:SpvB/TcaC N-terminal domain-containing protein [Pseudomonas sp. MG-9]
MKTTQKPMAFSAPSLPKGGGAIQSIGKGLAELGTHGTAGYEIALPISPGRGFSPALSLNYASNAGNGVFGIGWGISLPTVARRTSNGVPAYEPDDEIAGPGDDLWMPERDTKGNVIRQTVDAYKDLQLANTYSVVRHFPRVESTFDRIEHWSSNQDTPGFWLVHGADGSLHLYGKSADARRSDPQQPERVGEWLLEESMNAHGEHIRYQYETRHGQCYLRRIHYGNFEAQANLYAWATSGTADVQWHFELLFDYGVLSTRLTEKPVPVQKAWPERSDTFSSFVFGFQSDTRHLCRQVLMYHHFPEETGTDPTLVRRLLLEYRQSPLGYQQLSAAHDQAFDESARIDSRPPVEFGYSEFKCPDPAQAWQPFAHMHGLNDGQHYQLLDLYGEGMPGILYCAEEDWHYREPCRVKGTSDEVAYAQWHSLPRLPDRHNAERGRMSLCDLTGDGRLDWLIVEHGIAGFMSLQPGRGWSGFVPFDAFPLEFSSPQGQLADVMGNGLNDFALIGHRSVRLYANRRAQGFAPPLDVLRGDDDDELPVISASLSELVAFSDVLGSGQQHLLRIRPNEVKCWPNLGRGRFGKGIVLGNLNLNAETFDASRLRLADLDGSGAVDVVYLLGDQLQIFMNRGGTGFAPPVSVPWPQGTRYDSRCQVSVADLQGIGCSSLIFSVTQGQTRHWRYDFVAQKPYLLTSTNNNMGLAEQVLYRSSAQEWLDEKEQLPDEEQTPVCHMPFAMHLVSQQIRLDEVSGNRLTQCFRYRQGYYDGIERQFRGFGLLVQTDREIGEHADSTSGTAPCLLKKWFHTGQSVVPPHRGYDRSDKNALTPGKTLVTRHTPDDGDKPVEAANACSETELARALGGRLLRTELFGADSQSNPTTLYRVEQYRYAVRVLQPAVHPQRHARLLPLACEAVSYQYDGFTDDPQVVHTFNLQHDTFGCVTHCVKVHYARRLTTGDTSPFTDADEKQWWLDAHDPAQQHFYVSETLAEFIHLEESQGWRPALPWRQRTNALKFSAVPLDGGLQAADMSLEKLLERVKTDAWVNGRALTSMTAQRYRDSKTGAVLADGVAHFEALVDHLESAELDEDALGAFDVLVEKDRPGKTMLEASGYHRMAFFLPSSASGSTVWSVKSGFQTYSGLAGFYRAITLQTHKSVGVTEITYDAYWCLPTQFKLPDGCSTHVTYNYRTFQPRQITDPNGNIEEGIFDGFGQMLVRSFYRKKDQTLIGFKPVAEYRQPVSSDPASVIENPQEALQGMASAMFYAPCGWMGRLSAEARADKAWFKRCVTRQDVLPDGHVRAATRSRLTTAQSRNADEEKLYRELLISTRTPVRIICLSADRFADDDAPRQIRMNLTDLDGSGRTLQHIQKVESGPAYVIDEQGRPSLEGGKTKEAFAPQRWKVSGRVEYNNKGLPVRTCRAFFADRHHGLDHTFAGTPDTCDEHHYDALNRLTQVRLANSNGEVWLHRTTRHPWYTVEEDANDTFDEMSATPAGSTGDAA